MSLARPLTRRRYGLPCEPPHHKKGLLMPKYLFTGSYTAKGLEGLRDAGEVPSRRVD
jgi:hypothetical protein